MNSSSHQKYKKCRNSLNNKMKYAKESFYKREYEMRSEREKWIFKNKILQRGNSTSDIKCLSYGNTVLITEAMRIANHLNTTFVMLGKYMGEIKEYYTLHQIKLNGFLSLLISLHLI